MASLLQLGDKQPSLVDTGEKLRTVLAGNGVALTQGATDEAAGKDAAAKTTPNLAATEFMNTDRVLRRFVSLQGAFSQLTSFRRIDRRQLQNLLLWQGQRALDDFWGTIEAGRQQYFVQVVEAYMADVRLLAHPDADIDRGLQRLSALLGRRVNAASRGLATTSTDLVLIDEETAATANVGIWNTPATPDLPAGMAGVYLRDDNAILPQTLKPLEVGPGVRARRKNQHCKIAITGTCQRPGQSHGHDANRGHVPGP